jgi:hypothetical protein
MLVRLAFNLGNTFTPRALCSDKQLGAQHYVAKVDFYDAKCNRVTQLTLRAQHVGVVVFHSIMRLHTCESAAQCSLFLYEFFSTLDVSCRRARTCFTTEQVKHYARRLCNARRSKWNAAAAVN